MHFLRPNYMHSFSAIFAMIQNLTRDVIPMTDFFPTSTILLPCIIIFPPLRLPSPPRRNLKRKGKGSCQSDHKGDGLGKSAGSAGSFLLVAGCATVLAGAGRQARFAGRFQNLSGASGASGSQKL